MFPECFLNASLTCPECSLNVTVDEPVWKYGSGRVNEAMLTEHLCPITDDVTAMLCGPDPFMHKTCIPILKKFGIQEDRIVLF